MNIEKLREKFKKEMDKAKNGGEITKKIWAVKKRIKGCRNKRIWTSE